MVFRWGLGRVKAARERVRLGKKAEYSSPRDEWRAARGRGRGGRTKELGRQERVPGKFGKRGGEIG